MAWFPLFAPVLNHSGIPPAPRTIDLHLYTHDVKTVTQRYVVHTLHMYCSTK